MAAERLLDDKPAPRDRRPAQAPLHIDLGRLQEVGMVPPESARERLENEYRYVKRPLLANINGRGAVQVESGRVILVTSAQQGDGKTYTAFNLARSFAQEPDWEVVLIDGDNIRPMLSRHLCCEDRPGLIDALGESSLTLDDVLVPTDIRHLSVIPSGQRDLLATEYLSSRRMGQLMAQLTADERRIVLIDAPPLLGTSDALSLAETAGQILIVVRAGVTLRAAVVAAVQPLDKRKSINLLLNQVVKVHGDTYGGYYCGYGYGNAPKCEGSGSAGRATEF